ncbi:MAG: type II secretion system protein [Rhodocyclaceae bacterium]|nr:MAG: type II secretion system protein [Rhodocyclaceae bacterium]
MPRPSARQRGFTLAEMAVMLFIDVLLVGGLLVPLAAQVEARKVAETRRTLADIGEALLGFAASQGRLPCPAAGGATGVESPAGGGTCANPYDGFVPGVTLGITPTDDAGYVIDAWGQRIRYAVSRDPTSGTMSSNAASTPRWSFTSANGMRNTVANASCTTGIACLHPDLHVCSSGTASAQQTCAGTLLADSAVALWYSLGNNGTIGGTGSDESQNPNPNFAYANDRVFLSHEPTAAGATGGEFDDIVSWLSPNVLYSRMIAAGRLP